jgi:hypothetical protein
MTLRLNIGSSADGELMQMNTKESTVVYNKVKLVFRREGKFGLYNKVEDLRGWPNGKGQFLSFTLSVVNIAWVV